MEPYEKVIIRLLPGETPREKYFYLHKMANVLLKIKKEDLSYSQINNILRSYFTEEDLQKIVKG